jgi:uncharacterized BrkB/YihY/UPF0761 family membrane protein
MKEVQKLKSIALISAVITALLMLTTMICGLWIRSNGVTDPSSFDFHIRCGIASVVFSFVTLALFILMLARMKKKG